MYSIDSFNVYYDGKIVKNATSFNFKDLGDGYGKDSFSVFYKGKVIEPSTPFNFKNLGNGYGKDSFNVFYKGKVIEGVSPFSFQPPKNNNNEDDLDFEDFVKQVEINSRGILKAKLKNSNNVILKIDLNDYLGNNNGSFEIGGENFSETAENIYIVKNKKLRADLYDKNHNLNTDTIKLDKILKIKNNKLVFKNHEKEKDKGKIKKNIDIVKPEISVNCNIL